MTNNNHISEIWETLENEKSIGLVKRRYSNDVPFHIYGIFQYPENYFPSPSVFVYTLPNIVIGEIAIRHKIYGESSFYITEKFSAIQIFNSITDIFNTDKISSLLCGWTEYYDNN